MAEPPGNDRLFCREQVARANPLFRISAVFAPGAVAERLLPLYALFAALEELCAQASDAEVMHRKLEWWRSEFLARGPAESDHPVLRELMRSGAAPHLDPRVLAQLFDSAELRLDRPVPANADELETLCRLTGLPHCTLEFGVNSDGQILRAPATAACMGMAQLVREGTALGGGHRYWWLPLNLLARHGISRGELEQNVDAPAARNLFADVFRQCEPWAEDSRQEVEAAAHGSVSIRHLAVHAQLQAFAVQRLTSVPPGKYGDAIRRVGWGELLRGWRVARRFNRR